MRHVKSERLKKLEGELYDLQQWLKLGLVPKKDIEKHKEEILAIQSKMEEEKERLQFLKESGDAEEYVTPKKTPGRGGYAEMPTLPDIEVGESAGFTETNFDMETETADMETTVVEEKEQGEENEQDEEKVEEEEEESPFSDRNRWRRGGIVDPDADEW